MSPSRPCSREMHISHSRIQGCCKDRQFWLKGIHIAYFEPPCKGQYCCMAKAYCSGLLNSRLEDASVCADFCSGNVFRPFIWTQSLLCRLVPCCC